VLVFGTSTTLHISKELGPIVSSRDDGKIVVMPMRVT
jgi:hypothetical protein